MDANHAVRIGIVLSAGGLRGAAHLGVLQQLLRHQIPIDVIVGVSAGAIVAAYYAAAGRSLEELIADARAFHGRHLIVHSVNLRLKRRFDAALAPLSGLIPARLRELEAATFDRLHHGVQRLGIVCHDVERGRPCYFATGRSHGAQFSDVVRASASIPFLIPPRVVTCDGQPRVLTDGGLSDSIPVDFALREPLAATHIIVSDCRASGLRPHMPARTVYIRPHIFSTGTLWAPRSTLLKAIEEGAAAVTDDVLERIRGWSMSRGVPP